LIEALFCVHEGGAPMSPRVARAVVRELQTEAAPEAFLLSARERDVLRAIGEGLTYAEAGVRLGISAHTVHSHIKRSYEKLHAKDKQDALSKARRKGIL
jgi:two-component system NarL family response regulator